MFENLLIKFAFENLLIKFESLSKLENLQIKLENLR